MQDLARRDPAALLEGAQLVMSFRAEYGKKAGAGPLLHTGKQTQWLAAGILAAPWWRVL